MTTNTGRSVVEAEKGQAKHHQKPEFPNIHFHAASVPFRNLPADQVTVLRLTERAAGAKPDWPWYVHVLGLAYYRAGQYAEAIATFEQSTWSASIALIA